MMKKIGLALGSGGARGWAHIGAIKAIRKAGIPIHCVAGTSIGAFVGGAFASDRLDVLEEMALKLDWRHLLYYFFEVNFPRSGLIDGNKVVKFVQQYVMPIRIEDLPIPFRAVATDVLTGEEFVFSEGDVIEAIRASISIPGIFTPVEKDGAALVDGGLVNPIPVNIARGMGADWVIAVDINYDLLARARAQKAQRSLAPAPPRPVEADKKESLLNRINEKVRHLDLSSLSPLNRWSAKGEHPNIFDVMGNTLRIVEHQIGAIRLIHEPPDLLIRPAVGHHHVMDFHRAGEAIDTGYQAAAEALGTVPEFSEQGEG